jgi:hypothetical protein
MGIFSFLGASKAPDPIAENKSFEGFRSIDTEGLDLSQPFVDDYYSRGYSWVQFGQHNLYPQILNQLYISAPMHQACCNFKKYALTGKGYEWENFDKLEVKDLVMIKQFEAASNFKGVWRNICLDWIKHGRVTLLIHHNGTRHDYFKHVDPQDIRNSAMELFKDRPDKYFYARDWARSTAQYQFTPYSSTNKDQWQVLELRNNVGGFISYGMPDWVSSANWSKVGADASLLHKSAIENGIQPSVIYKYPYIMSPDERAQWDDGMRRNAKGAKNYGRAMKVESQSKDLSPDIDIVKTTDNHKLFEQTSREYKEEVAISHNLNPALMGVKIAGSLGQSDEIEFSAKQFEKVWYSDNHRILEEFFNRITTICGISSDFILPKTNIIDIVEMIQDGGTTDDGVEVAPRSIQETALNGAQISSLLLIIENYNTGVISREAAVTIITSSFPSVPQSKAQEMVPLSPQEISDEANGVTPSAELDNSVNDALKGLSAKENQDMMRIVRDFSKGRLAEPLARTRLMAYGIDNTTINEILTL